MHKSKGKKKLFWEDKFVQNRLLNPQRGTKGNQGGKTYSKIILSAAVDQIYESRRQNKIKTQT